MEQRSRPRPAYRGLEVERAYEARHGTRLPYWEIALRLYEETGSCRRVAERLESEYGIRLEFKTASVWINLALSKRQARGIEEVVDSSEALS